MDEHAQRPAIATGTGDVLAELRGVSQSFAGDGRQLIVLQDINLTIPPGEVVADHQNAAYNRDRGPVSVVSLRGHIQTTATGPPP